MSRPGTPAALSASMARRATTSLEYAFQTVVTDPSPSFIATRYLIATCLGAQTLVPDQRAVPRRSGEARQSPPMAPAPTDQDYRQLLQLRTGLRRFLRWSER